MTEEREFLHWALVIEVAGPNYRDRVTVNADDLIEFQAELREVNGLTYERYRGELEEEYTEIRFDYIVSRTVEAVYSYPPPTPVPAQDVDNGDVPVFDPDNPRPQRMREET